MNKSENFCYVINWIDFATRIRIVLYSYSLKGVQNVGFNLPWPESSPVRLCESFDLLQAFQRMSNRDNIMHIFDGFHEQKTKFLCLLPLAWFDTDDILAKAYIKTFELLSSNFFFQDHVWSIMATATRNWIVFSMWKIDNQLNSSVRWLSAWLFCFCNELNSANLLENHMVCD